MPYSITTQDGITIEDIPDHITPDDASLVQRVMQVRSQNNMPMPASSKERTWGEALATDPYAQLVSGVGALAKFPGQMYGLATGDWSKTGFLGAGTELEEYAQGKKSAGLKAREAEVAQNVAEAEKRGIGPAAWAAIKGGLSDPALAAGMLLEQLPGLAPSIAAAIVAPPLTPEIATLQVAARKALGTAAEKAAVDALKAATEKAATRAAVVTGGVQAGAGAGESTYKTAYDSMIASGVSPAEAADRALTAAREAGLSNAVIMSLAQKLPGAGAVERAIARVPGEGGVLAGAAKGAAGEALGMGVGMGGGKLAENVALAQQIPGYDLTTGVGGALGSGATTGALMGGTSGFTRAREAQRDVAQEAAQQRVLAAQEARRLAEAEAQAKAEGEKPIGAMGPYSPEQYGVLEQEKQQLMQGPQAPNVKERIAEITQAQKQMTIASITRGREEKAQQESEAKKAAESAFSQPEVRETPEGQGLLFSQFEAPEARIQPETLPAPATREERPLAPSTLEKQGQRRLGLLGGKEGEGLYKGEAPKAEAGVTGTTREALKPMEPIAPVQPVSEAVPEPKLAPKRVVPPELQPVIDSLIAAGVRPETKTWAENGRNRPFLRKLVEMSVMAPEARQEARKALKLEEGSHKAEVFDALFPTPRVPAFEPAARAGKPSVGVPSEPRPVTPAEPVAPGAGEAVGRGVVPTGGAAPTPTAPEIGAKPALKAAEPALPRAEQYWNDTAEAVGGKKPFSELTPAQRSAWREAVKEEDVGTLRSEYERITAETPVAQPSRAAEVKEARRKATEAEVREQRAAKEEEKPSLGGERTKQVTDFEQTLRTALNKFGLKDVGLKLVEGMQEAGSYAQKLIKIASDSANPIRTLRHESIHALRELGFFTDAQWQSLSKMAKDKWIDQYLKQRNVDGKPLKAGEESRYDAYLREYDGNMEKITEEAVADAFADFDATKPPAGMVASIVTKLRNMFQALKSALTKVESPEQIFGKVERGALKAGEAAEMGEAKSLRTNPLAPAKPSDIDQIARSSELMKDKPSYLKSSFRDLLEVFTAAEGVSLATRLRTRYVNRRATLADRLGPLFRGMPENKLVKLVNPEISMAQAEAASNLIGQYAIDGAVVYDPKTTLHSVTRLKDVPAYNDVLKTLDSWAKDRGQTFEEGKAVASKILEGMRLDDLREQKKAGLSDVIIHKMSEKDPRTADQQIDAAVAAFKADPKLSEIRDMLNKARFHIIDEAVDAGWLSAEQAKLWKEVVNYVPFDRISEFEDVFRSSKVKGRGLAQMPELAKLIGTTQREVGDVFDNHLKTMGSLLERNMAQRATLYALRTLEDLGHAKYIGKTDTAAKYPVKTYIKGEAHYFDLPTRYDLMAYKDMTATKGAVTRTLQAVSNVLRKTITVMPPFAIKQLTDDLQRIYVNSGLKNPYAAMAYSISNFAKIGGAALLGKEHPLVHALARKGITGMVDFNPIDPADSVLKNLGYVKRGKFGELIHRLDAFTHATDIAVRQAIYDQTLRETKTTETPKGDELLATTRAREFINFRNRGHSDLVNVATATVPFFNAYLQAMDVLYRNATGKNSTMGLSTAVARRMFWAQVAKMGAFSAIYSLAVSGTDDYKDVDLNTRNNNFILPGTGRKIGVPNELAALYKVPVENLLEYVRRSGTNEEQEASEAAITALQYAFAQYSPVGGRITPIPAAIKPLLEIISDHSFTFGRSLEGTYQQNLLASERKSSQTSEAAVAIAKFIESTFDGAQVSPIHIDTFLNGYFGSVAGLTTMITDQLLNPDKLDRPINQQYLIGQYSYKEVGTRKLDEFYDVASKVLPVQKTLNHLKDTNPEAAAKFVEAHTNELVLAQGVAQTQQELSKIRKLINQLNSPIGVQIEPKKEEREKLVKEMQQAEIQRVGWLREVRASLNKTKM